MTVQFQKLNPDVKIPEYATAGSAGFDLVVDHFITSYYRDKTESEADKDKVFMTPESRLLVGCGFAIKIPNGFMLDIRTRSGKALKEGLIVLNAPGTIDSDYIGEIGVILFNSSQITVEVSKGDRVAQGILLEQFKVDFKEVEILSGTARGTGGYGSTGK